MPHRKRIKHFHRPGDLHELTFSCYQRQPLLTQDEWIGVLFQAIDKASREETFNLVAFVVMPEHVHLLVDPIPAEPDIGRYLARIKRPVSAWAKQHFELSGSPLLDRLTVQERPGKTCFRFWQEGPGYDRNLNRPETILAAIGYLHENPVRRGLCVRGRDWRWSSAAWYDSDGQAVDEALPTIHGLRPGTLDRSKIKPN